MNRTLIVSLMLAFAALGTQPPAGAADPYAIDAVLPSTGSASFLGSQEIKSLAVLENLVNAHGGVHGRPIRFVVTDDQSSPVVAVQLTNAVIAKRAPIVIGSSVAATCSAIAPLVERSGPVNYCLSPVMHGAPGSYVFSASAGSNDIAIVLARFYREHGWTRIALITSTDASGSDFDRQFDAALLLPENKSIQLIDREHFNPSDLSVAAQMARIKSADPQALITFTTGTPLGTVLHGFHDSGMDIPITASAGNMIYPQMAQYKDFMPKRLFFAATRGVAPDAGLGNGPIKDAQSAYFAAFKAAGLRPDFATALAWDPAMILVDALRHTGLDAGSEAVHAYIEGLHSWAGIDGIYDFRDNGQRGIGQNAMVVYAWNAGRDTFEVVSKAGGRLK